MASYVLIESRDPIANGDVRNTYGLARELAATAGDVTVFLTQNAVLGARRASPASSDLADVLGAATVLADDFCLAERGVTENDLVPGISSAGIETVVDLAIDEGRTVLWN